MQVSSQKLTTLPNLWVHGLINCSNQLLIAPPLNFGLCTYSNCNIHHELEVSLMLQKQILQTEILNPPEYNLFIVLYWVYCIVGVMRGLIRVYLRLGIYISWHSGMALLSIQNIIVSTIVCYCLLLSAIADVTRRQACSSHHQIVIWIFSEYL